MKKTFGTHQEVCHVWISQSQRTGKAGYFRFSGKVLYCDNKPLARLYGEKTVLISPNIVEDCRMREKIYKAMPKGYKKFEVPSISPLNHNKNIASFMKNIRASYKSFWNARQAKKNCIWYSNYRTRELRAYVRHFNLKMPSLKGVSLNTKNVEANLREYNLKNAANLWDEAHKLNKHRDEVDKRKKELIPEIKRLKKDWLNGTSNLTSLHDPLAGHVPIITGMMLRKVGSQIETTYGAFVPVKRARVLYKAIKAKKPLAGFRIGHYKVDSMNGSLKIGCHNIPRKEIDRLAKSLGW